MFSNEAPLVFRPQADWRQWCRGLQFLAQTLRSQAGSAAVHQRCGGALVAEKALRLQGIEQGIELPLGFLVRRQLAPQLRARVLAPRQAAQCAGPER